MLFKAHIHASIHHMRNRRNVDVPNCLYNFMSSHSASSIITYCVQESSRHSSGTKHINWHYYRKEFPDSTAIVPSCIWSTKKCRVPYSELPLQSYRLVNITDIHQLAHRKMVRKCWCSNIKTQVVRCTSRHKSPRLVNGDYRTQEVFNNMPSGLALEVLHKCGYADVV